MSSIKVLDMLGEGEHSFSVIYVKCLLEPPTHLNDTSLRTNHRDLCPALKGHFRCHQSTAFRFTIETLFFQVTLCRSGMSQTE